MNETKITLHHKYKNLYNPHTRYFIVTGGRGSAKSFGVGTFITQLSFESGHKVLFTRYTMISASLSIVPEFIHKTELMDSPDAFRITKKGVVNTYSGSEIIFSGLKTSSGDQTANLKSLQGITTWVLDEAEELKDEDTFDKIDLSIREKGKHNRVILIMNPSTKEHWVYQRFFQNMGVEPGFNGIVGDVCYIHSTWEDNRDNLSESYITRALKIKDINPAKYQHVMLGGWLEKAEGVIFNNWMVGEFDESRPFMYGQDYGFSIDPTTLVKVAVDESKGVLYIQELLYKPGLSTSDIARENLNKANNGLIVADSAEPRLISELQDAGINIEKADKPPGSVTSGISKMMGYKIIITPGSENLAKELNNYAWADKKTSIPVDKWNHAIDAARYAFMKLTGGYGNYAWVAQ